MVNAAQAMAAGRAGLLLGDHEVDLEQPPRLDVLADEVEQAAIDRADGRDRQLVRPDPTLELRRQQRRRPAQRLDLVAGPQAEGAQRRSVDLEVALRERLWLSIQDEVDLA